MANKNSKQRDIDRILSERREFFDKLSAPPVAAWRSILMIYRMAYGFLDAELFKMGMSLPRLQIFIALYFQGPMVPNRLAKRLGVTRGNMTSLLKRMIAEGLVKTSSVNGTEKRPAYDLTEKGLELFEAVYPEHIENVKRLIPHFDEDLLNKLLDLQKALAAKTKMGIPLASDEERRLVERRTEKLSSLRGSVD